MRKLLPLIFLLCLLARTAYADDVTSAECFQAAYGIPEQEALYDMDLEATQRVQDGASVTLNSPEGISGLYLVFDLPYGSLTLSEGDTSVSVDTGGLLHTYLDVQEVLGEVPLSVTLTFSSGEASLNELRVLSPGELPDWVQQWRKISAGEADLLLLSTHGDDEQLFFAGLLPWYAVQQEKRVQVVYFTDHRNMTAHRVHEMLNGLWAVGVRDYPVFGAYPDYYTFDMEDAYNYYEGEGYSRENLLMFVTDCLRYYRPLVAVGHDEKGEYGHGMHQLTSDLLKQASEISGDENQFPQSAEEYGVWDVPKTYLHLYSENPITMNWDIPMEAFDGKTAYQVTRDLGFPCHASQVADFAWYFRGADSAAEVERYSPCAFGLYRTTVGLDTGKGDFFENLESYRQPETPTQSTAQTVAQENGEPSATAAQAVSVQTAQSAAAEAAPAASPKTDSQQEAASGLNAEQTWLAIPAAGAAALTASTAAYAAARRREKF